MFFTGVNFALLGSVLGGATAFWTGISFETSTRGAAAALTGALTADSPPTGVEAKRGTDESLGAVVARFAGVSFDFKKLVAIDPAVLLRSGICRPEPVSTRFPETVFKPQIGRAHV